MKSFSKNLKIFAIILVIAIGGYVYLMGGFTRAFEQIQAGEFLNFENKSDNSEYVNVLVYFDKSDYEGKINLNQWKSLNNLNKTITSSDKKKLISKLGLVSSSYDKRKDSNINYYEKDFIIDDGVIDQFLKEFEDSVSSLK